MSVCSFKGYADCSRVCGILPVTSVPIVAAEILEFPACQESEFLYEIEAYSNCICYPTSFTNIIVHQIQLFLNARK